MIRLTMVLGTLLCVLGPATAAVNPRSEKSRSDTLPAYLLRVGRPADT
jgi:hypothetical protein